MNKPNNKWDIRQQMISATVLTKVPGWSGIPDGITPPLDHGTNMDYAQHLIKPDVVLVCEFVHDWTRNIHKQIIPSS